MIKQILFLILFIPTIILRGQIINHSDTLDILNYNLNLDIDISGQTIQGIAQITAISQVDNLTYFPLDLQGLTVDSVFINDTICNFLYNDTLLHILPSHVYHLTDTVLLSVYYHGHPGIDPSGWGGFYFSGTTAYNLGVGFQDIPHNYGRVWFPCLDDFNDRATYDFHITTADNLVAVCNGTLIETINNGNGTKTWHWILHQSIPSYLASVAVSNYVLVPDTFYGMQDTIPIGIYVASGDSAQAVASFANLKQILAGYEQYFGPYQWERIGYVGVPFNSGAMEHATNIAYPAVVIDGTSSYEYLYAHELSHHWFGNYLTCASAEDMWINEGWAVFAEAFYHEFLYDKATYLSYIMNIHANAIHMAQYDDGGIYPLYPMPQNVTYGTTTYQKGASVVHTLRNYLGDSLFFDAVRAYVSNFALTNVSSYDLRNFLTAYTGVDMTDFFNSWVFSPGYPHFSVDSFSVVPNGGNFDVTVFIRQRLRDRTNFTNSNRTEVTFSDDSWHFQTETVNFSGEFGQATFSLNFNPTHAYMDLENKICDARTSDSKVISNAATIPFHNTYLTLYVNQISDSAFLQVTHNWIAPDTFKQEIPGLYLTDKRYWKVEGILPNTFNITARFLYSKATTGSYAYLDNGFLTSPDSLVLLYRRNSADDWQITNAYKQGTSTNGYLTLDTIMIGEYAFGIWNRTITIREKMPEDTKPIKIFPNPSNTGFYFQQQKKSVTNFKIFNASGKQIFSGQIIGEDSYLWQPDVPGLYLVSFFDSKGKIITKKQVLATE
ncbi:MAG TPA: T9SS type A sorting domain-containing protein [Bacteroidales bacterium]|nr:T9SS type A sorting domain-containing protein [Bacteroidales bacterium]